MKDLNNYIVEKFRASNDMKVAEIKYHPETRMELMKILYEKVKTLGSDGFLDCSDIDVSKVEEMQYIFAELNDNIKTIDLTGWDTSNVKSMHTMFSNLKNLTNIIGIEKIDVQNVRTFHYMFSNTKIKNINLNNWTVEQSEGFPNMFKDYKQLQSCDISNWDVRNSSRFESMFENCKKLQKCDISSWKPKPDADFTKMFFNCEKLTDLKIFTPSVFGDKLTAMFRYVPKDTIPDWYKNNKIKR